MSNISIATLAGAFICAAINFLLLLILNAKGKEASPYVSRRPFIENQNHFLLTVFFGIDLDKAFYLKNQYWIIAARANLAMGLLFMLGFLAAQPIWGR